MLPLNSPLHRTGGAPMGRVVIGGLLSSTVVTLVLVPVIYSIFEQRLKRKS